MVTENNPNQYLEQEKLQENLSEIRRKIAAAARSAGRDPDEITLIAVTKRFSEATIRLALRCNLRDLGENRVQELRWKMDALTDATPPPRWHLIGTLQKNKVKYVVGRCALIHSVDSLDLLRQIERQSEKRQLTSDILLQVNASGEESKHGFSQSDLIAAARLAQDLAHVRLRGLMTMAPIVDDPKATRPVFAQTQKLLEELRQTLPAPQQLDILSMGMSQDYAEAIACGATHVRLGTALFGARPQ